MKRSKRMRRRHMSDRWSGNASLVNTGPTPLSQIATFLGAHDRVKTVRGPKHDMTPFSSSKVLVDFEETWFGEMKPVFERRPNTWLDWFPVLKRTNIDNPRTQYVETFTPIRLSPRENKWKIVFMYFMGPRAFLIMQEPQMCRFRRSSYYTVEGAKRAYQFDEVNWIDFQYYTPPE